MSLHLGNHAPRPFGDFAPQWGQSDPRRASLDKRRLQPPFQLPDLGTEGRLRNVLSLGSPAEVQFLREGDQVTQLPQRGHRLFPFMPIVILYGLVPIQT